MATVRAIEKLEAVQIIHDGHVVATSSFDREAPELKVTKNLLHRFQPKVSGWLAARALYRAPDGMLRQAHTSPIYLRCDDKPVAFPPDARYMIRWIDHLTELASTDSDRFPTAAARDQVLVDYREAKQVYESVVRSAHKQ